MRAAHVLRRSEAKASCSPAQPASPVSEASLRMDVYLIDGTYELFRHYYAMPSVRDSNGVEVGAVRGVVASIGGMLKSGVSHVGVATDHIIESFRNQLWPGYKTGAGIPRDLWSQFGLLEEAMTAMGVAVWPMIEFEADDALASAAETAARDSRVSKVIICTPDKDLAQCVRGTRVVQMDRRKRVTRDEQGVIDKFGVPPALIPDYLALVGDSSDGYPGLRGWGPKTAAALLSRFGNLEGIPDDRLNPAQREQAMLFRVLATLRADIPLFESVDVLEWHGVRPEFAALAARFDRAPATK
jgi:5'-3' exonuclease